MGPDQRGRARHARVVPGHDKTVAHQQTGMHISNMSIPKDQPLKPVVITMDNLADNQKAIYK